MCMKTFKLASLFLMWLHGSSPNGFNIFFTDINIIWLCFKFMCIIYYLFIYNLCFCIIIMYFTLFYHVSKQREIVFVFASYAKHNKTKRNHSPYYQLYAIIFSIIHMQLMWINKLFRFKSTNTTNSIHIQNQSRNWLIPISSVP